MTYQKLPTVTAEVLTERVGRTLREAIVNGTLQPGERLVEDRIAEQMGVSRAPIREALLVLQREGLVESLPRRGVIVSVITRSDVHEIYRLRSALECQAGRDACRRISTQDLEELGVLVRQMERSSLAGEGESLAVLDAAFHRKILEVSGNGRLLKAWQSIMSQVRMLQRYALGSPDTNVGGIARQHEGIREALGSGDPDRAERCLRDHIETVTHEVFESFPQSKDEHPRT